jgi:large subunit ribosomal protein L17
VPQPKRGPSLGANPSHQRLMLRNLARSLFEHERVTTTEAKAKLLSPYAERLITKAKKGSLHHRRQVLSALGDREVTTKLFEDIAPRFSTRNGGYTRVLKVGPRNGDGAPMALIELLQASVAAGSVRGEEETRRRRLRRPRRRGASGEELPQDKPVRSQAAEAGAAGMAPAEGEPAVDEGPAPAEPDETSTATPDDEGPSGAGGEPGRQRGAGSAGPQNGGGAGSAGPQNGGGAGSAGPQGQAG